MVSRRLAEMMQGEIGVSSEPGRGSRFWFTAVFGRRALRERVSTSSIEARSGALLVSADERRCRELLFVLQRQGLPAVYAVDAVQALAAVAAMNHELVLIDNEHGRSLGAEEVQRLRAALAAAAVPIAVLLPAGAGGECVIYRAAGADLCVERVAGAPIDSGIDVDAWLAAIR